MTCGRAGSRIPITATRSTSGAVPIPGASKAGVPLRAPLTGDLGAETSEPGDRPARSCYVATVPVSTTELRLSTRGDSDVIDITKRVVSAVADSGVRDGQATAFVRGSTAAVTTREHRPGGIQALRALLDRLIPAA